MQSFLLLVVFIAIVALAVFASKLVAARKELHDLQLNLRDKADGLYRIWVDQECANIRIQQLAIARQEAAAELQQWKNTSEASIRQDAIQRSQSVILGKVTEHLVPYLPSFAYNPKDARFIGTPIDILVFDGMDAGDLREIVFIEVKTGPTAILTKRERQVRDVVCAGRIKWQELRVDRVASDTA